MVRASSANETSARLSNSEAALDVIQKFALNVNELLHSLTDGYYANEQHKKDQCKHAADVCMSPSEMSRLFRL